MRSVRESVTKVSSAGDIELSENLVKMVLDRARADEQASADLWIAVTVTGHHRDAHFLGCQGFRGGASSLAHCFARCKQLAAGTLGECVRAHSAEALVGGAQVFACVCSAVGAAKPFPIRELASRELDCSEALRESLY